MKHTPGRGHDTRSGPPKKRQFRREAIKQRKEKAEAARRLWAAWDALSEEQKKLLGPKGEPKVPRPEHED